MPVAKHMHAKYHGKGSFIWPKFSISHYSTSAMELFPIIWEDIRTLEYAALKVISLTGDGCSANRKFFICTDQRMETLIQQSLPTR